ncbi:oxidoreductase [Rhodococcus koreensis]
MPVDDLFVPLTMAHGPQMKNRILLAPLTNQQSNLDGTASEHDLNWIRTAADGGYAMTMTCATNVQANGKAFQGQLGIYDDRHLEGLSKMADAIREGGSVSSVQLHHGGIRALGGINGQPVGPSEDPASGARALTTGEVEEVRDSFVSAAKRAQSAGFDGAEIHGAFGFLVAQFLSPTLNRRSDRYGGSVERRSRFLFEIFEGIRRECGPDFQIGLRLSMERYGVLLAELRDVAAEAMRCGLIDYLDLAPWDIDQTSREPGFEGQTLLSVFTQLPRGHVRVGASGHVLTAQRAVDVLDRHDCDFVMIGRAAILEPNYPHLVRSNADHMSPTLPVTHDYLRGVGLGPEFIDYMANAWPGFVRRCAEPAS